MVFNELLFSSLGLLNEIADEPLTFQQMYLELNSILILTNRPKVDRDSFLIYLSINGYISLSGIGEQKLTLGNLSIKNHLNVHEAYIKSSYGVSYYTLLFAKEVRLEIYRKVGFYFDFVNHFPLRSSKLSSEETALLSEMISENLRLDIICINLLRKPMRIYQAISTKKIIFPDDPKA